MVRHVLADGTALTDITGYVVRETDAESVYKIMEGLKHEEENETDHR